MNRDSPTGRVASDVLDTIGGTPLVYVASIHGWRVFAKLEKVNPGQSTKDRMALSIIESAERRGDLRPGDTIVESSSGNTATALAMVAAVRGYKFIAVMDHHASKEKIATVRAYGAHVVLAGSGAPNEVAAVERLVAVKRIQLEQPTVFFANQADNPDNPTGYETLADELVRVLAPINVVVGGIGSGGSLLGTAGALRARGCSPLIVGVEPVGSVIFDGPPAPYFQSGAGSPIGLPLAKNIDLSQVDDHRRVTDRQAFNTARALARVSGLLLGGSSGAALYAAFDYAATTADGGNIVVLAPDGGEKYLSTIFNDDWMCQHDLVDDGIAQQIAGLVTGRDDGVQAIASPEH